MTTPTWDNLGDVVAASTGAISVSGIPNTYKHLHVTLTVTSSTSVDKYLTVNGSGASMYRSFYSGTTNGGLVCFEQVSNTTSIWIPQSNSGGTTNIVMEFEINMANKSQFKTVVGQIFADSTNNIGLFSGAIETLSSISSLSISSVPAGAILSVRGLVG